MENDQAESPRSSASASAPAALEAGWERSVLEKLAFAQLKEAKSRRRWTIFFRMTGLLLVGIIAWQIFGFGESERNAVGRHTALIEIDGPIEAGGGSGSADNVILAMNKAYADADSAAVVIRINSPGGSPVQAGMINDEMQRLRTAYPKKPLYVVVDEMCASGGYYIAAGADRVYVNKASIVGSIGVLMDGFGFSGLMEKLGIERRMLTAGENKGFLDPFSPQTARHKELAQSMLNEVHQQFIDVVRKGRGERLKETPETFSGLFWTGAKAVEIGLADAIGTVDSVARDVVKAEDIIDYSVHEGLPERVLKKFGAAVGESAARVLLKTEAPALR